MQTTELRVEGMSCGACVAAVTQALRRVPGLTEVKVDLTRGVAWVAAGAALPPLATMVAALAEAGYAAGPAQAPRPGEPGAGAERGGAGCGQGGSEPGRKGCGCGGS